MSQSPVESSGGRDGDLSAMATQTVGSRPSVTSAGSGGGANNGIAATPAAVARDPWGDKVPDFRKPQKGPGDPEVEYLDWFMYVLCRLVLMLKYLKVPAKTVAKLTTCPSLKTRSLSRRRMAWKS